MNGSSCSPMRIVGMLVWVIVSLAAINIGASVLFDINVLESLPLRPVAIIIGVAGVLSLLMCIQSCMGKCMCGGAACKCCTGITK